jgi:hypothetical protein
MAISNPISKAGIVGRYNDFVADTANAGISWGSNAKPTVVYGGVTYNRIRSTDEATAVAGSTAGLGDTSSTVLAGTVIDASDIYDKLSAATLVYTNLRNIQAIFYIQGAGGNSGSISTPTGYTYSTQLQISNAYGYTVTDGGYNVSAVTAKSHLATSTRRTDISINDASTYSLETGDTVNDTNLESFFQHMQDRYVVWQDLLYDTFVNWTCHTSCHNSCHSSRGRR